MKPNVEEFIKFHGLLTKDAPGYEPFYFPLERNGKDPLKSISWKQNRKTFEQAQELMRKGYNIGIAATDSDPLVIVDVDDIKEVGELKPTLINQSRKRIGRHGFYFTDQPLAKSIFDNTAKQNIATEDAGEVRANWQYVVAAGSYVTCSPEEIEKIPISDRENAGYYTVMVEHTVSHIEYHELPETYRVCLQNKRAADIASKTRPARKTPAPAKDLKNVSKLWSLDIHDVIGKRDNPTHRFPSPFHGSKTYKDTSISQGMLHCWRHNVSHTGLTALAVMCGYASCSDAGYGHHGSGTTALNFDDGELIYKIWRHAKDTGLISMEDPMPTKAMVHYAVSNELCKEEDIVDGWKIPHDVYNQIIETAPFPVGRNPLTKKITQTVQNSMNTPLQIANTLLEEVPIWFDHGRNYWMWSKEHERYDRIDETEILCQIIEAINIDSVYRSKFKTELLESIRITGRRRRVENTPREWVQLKNCVVNIETCERFQATPDYFFAAPVPHNFGKSEETPVMDKIFEAWVGPEKKQLLYEICAYCLYDGYPIHRIFCLIGVGRNGKGQFMELLRRFLGHHNYVSTDLDRLAKSQFEASKLFKKKAAFIGETNFDTMSRTNIIKQLSGGDLVSCEFKGRDAFDFQNTAKLVVATNSLPATTDRTEGFYRRWLIIEFNNRFNEGKDIIDTIPDEEYDNLARKCIPILKNLLSVGKFTAEGTVEERAKTYEKKSNPINTFIDEYCENAPEAFTPTWYLYQQYETFQTEGGHRKLSKDEF
jgi:putative DNA primase/helicase